MSDSRGAAHTRRSRKNIVMFAISLGLGGAAVFYSKHYIEQQIAYYKGELERTERMVSVVVPNRPLTRGEIVTAEMLSTRKIPEKYVDGNAVNEGNYDVALGQRVDFAVDEGRPLLWAHLEGGLSPTFSGKVPEGLRAMTVRVDEINSISGFLQPKDRVDLLMSHGSGDEQVIFPLIERLDVIATGVQTVVDKNGQGHTRGFSTITVQVSPEQAQKITLAQQAGRLTAVLRNPEDEAPLLDGAMSVAELLGAAPPQETPAPPPARRATPEPVRAAPAPPGIEYIIGGGR